MLNYEKHPVLIAAILAIIIALLNYITLVFFFEYAEFIFGFDFPKFSPDQLPQPPFDTKQLPPPFLPPFHHHHPHISFAIKQILFNFLLAFILYIINFYIYAKTTLTPQKRIIWSITISIIATIIFCLTSIHTDVYLRTLHGHHPVGLRMIELVRSSITRDGIVGVISIFSALLMFYIRKQEVVRIENEMLVAENLRSQYNALTSKLDPHFLFNSLNTLKALIKSDSEKAQEYTQQLSDIFRYTINHKDIISLKEEIDFCHAYSNMMQIRYENSLDVTYNVNPEYLELQILPFSIQTLIENAIKHNTISLRNPLTIEIICDNTEYIIVKNPKNPKKEIEQTNGLGLKNLNDRYKHKTQKEIEIANSADFFSVKVPIIK